jgi:hypothetical protein
MLQKLTGDQVRALKFPEVPLPDGHVPRMLFTRTFIDLYPFDR